MVEQVNRVMRNVCGALGVAAVIIVPVTGAVLLMAGFNVLYLVGRFFTAW